MNRQWIGLAVLASVALLLSLDVSVLYLALPQLSAELDADAAQQLWIMDVYSFMLAGFLVTMGTLGDRIGRRKLLMIGAAAFGAASLLAAYSTSAEMLILTRALLGVAGATLMPSTMALLRTMFPDPKQMSAAIGLWFSCFMAGLALGPLVGGLLLQHFWWGSAFLLGVPFMALLLVAGPLVLPEYRAPNAGRLDLASVALSLAAILPLIWGLKEAARNGWHTAPALAVAAGLAFGVIFVRRQRHLPHPLLDLGLFGNRVFTVTMTIMTVGGVVMAGTTLLSTLYLQLVAGLSPLEAGLWLIPQNIAMIASLSLAPLVARRIRPAYVIATGLLVGTAGFLLHTQADAVGGLPLVVAGLVLASAGIAMPMGVGNGLVMSAAPQEKAGSAAAVTETGGEFGIALGLAALGSLATAVYRAQLPDGFPEAAREGIAAAAHLLAEAPARLAVAAEAFTTGLNTAAWVCAALFAALAALAVLTLRAVRLEQAFAPEEAPAERPQPAVPAETLRSST